MAANTNTSPLATALYQNGDIDLNNLKNYLDSVCIVETKDGKKKLLKIGYESGIYFLYGNNLKQKGIPFVEISVRIKEATPVSWHRMLRAKEN